MKLRSTRLSRQLRRPLARCGLALAAMVVSSGTHAYDGGALAPGLTLYGLIDTGIEYVSNVGVQKSSAIRMPSLTSSYPSRWGLRGIEDLGGSYKSIVVLESGFSPSQGTANQNGRLFGRQAYVGLVGPWGAVSVGRLYSQIYYSLIGDTLGPNIFAAGLLDTYLSTARVDNAIDYNVTFSGFTVGATYSFGRDAVAPAAAGGCAGESPSDYRACKAISILVKYEAPTWGVAGAFDRNYGGGGAGSPLPKSSQTDTRRLINGYVKFGTATVGAGFLRRNNQGSVSAGISDATSDYWWIGANYLPIPQVSLDLQYGHLTVKASSTGASVIAARATYLLSKRSAVYVTAGRAFNQRDGSFTIDGGAAGTVSTPLPGVDQTGFLVGIRHKF
ncbi:porin [Cupriavidus basilensis OR16]|uniref:Porin n=1 Tax=Cupriavidus basilensis OR16 TaxID=1127483 RepID=H1S7H6_9BURK|nr:porin [Cupriavidus basilensis]EHP41570.1 porin [Cupriavidus basilensis OR16]